MTPIPHDELWKDIIEALFPYFIQFFAPQFYDDVNWDMGFQFLDKELAQISPESAAGKRYVDKLVKVYLQNGAEQWVLVHVEVQSHRDEEFAERMFIYFYRIYDKFHRQVLSIAVFADPNLRFKPDRFVYEFYDCRNEFKYPAFTILEYDDEDLLKGDNPFAMVVLAAKKSLESRGDDEKRYVFKVQLIRLLLKSGYGRREIEWILRFLDGIMALSDEMQEQLIYEEFYEQEGEKMPYVTSWERIAMRKGMLAGILAKSRESVLEVLEERFGEIPEEVKGKIESIEDTEGLKKLHRQALRVINLSEFQIALSN